MVWYKKILIFILCILFLFLSNCSVSADTVDTEGYNNLYLRQYNSQAAFINYMLMRKGDENAQTAVNTLYYNYFQNIGRWGFSIFVSDYTESGSSDIANAIYYCYTNDLTAAYGTIVRNNITYNNQLVYTGTFYRAFAIKNDGTFDLTNTYITGNFPSAFLSVFHPMWYDLFKEYGLISNNDSTSIISALNNLSSQTQTNVNSIIEQQKATQNSIEDNTQVQQETQNFIKDGTVEDDSFNLPSTSTTDITQEGVNGIFSAIYNGFCSGSAQDIIVPVPFTDKSFIIPANYTINILNTSGFEWLKTLIQGFWWYCISSFIIYDVMKKVEQAKNGNIDKIAQTNIKGDML